MLETGRIDAWFWAHEHRCLVYKPHMKIGFSSCVGHGGIPEYLIAKEGQPYPEPLAYDYRLQHGDGLRAVEHVRVRAGRARRRPHEGQVRRRERRHASRGRARSSDVGEGCPVARVGVVALTHRIPEDEVTLEPLSGRVGRAPDQEDERALQLNPTRRLRLMASHADLVDNCLAPPFRTRASQDGLEGDHVRARGRARGRAGAVAEASFAAGSRRRGRREGARQAASARRGRRAGRERHPRALRAR